MRKLFSLFLLLLLLTCNNKDINTDNFKLLRRTNAPLFEYKYLNTYIDFRDYFRDDDNNIISLNKGDFLNDNIICFASTDTDSVYFFDINEKKIDKTLNFDDSRILTYSFVEISIKNNNELFIFSGNSIYLYNYSEDVLTYEGEFIFNNK